MTDSTAHDTDMIPSINKGRSGLFTEQFLKVTNIIAKKTIESIFPGKPYTLLSITGFTHKIVANAKNWCLDARAWPTQL